MIINQISSKSVNLITLICCICWTCMWVKSKCWLVINVNTTVNKCGFFTHPPPYVAIHSTVIKTFYLFNRDRFSMTWLILIFYALHCMWSSLAFPTLFVCFCRIIQWNVLASEGGILALHVVWEEVFNNVGVCTPSFCHLFSIRHIN